MRGLESPRDLVRRNTCLHGGRPAVVYAGGSLSYRELAGMTAELAEGLRGAGVGPGVQVALVLANSVAFLAWHFGVLEAGGIVVPLPPAITPVEAGWLLESSGIGHLAASPDSLLAGELRFSRADAGATTVDTCLWRGEREVRTVETKPWTPRGFITRQFSSGSTGRPKAMLKTEANIAHDCRHLCERLDLSDADMFLGVAPFYHCFGALSFLSAFSVGGCVSVLPRFLPGPVLEAARRTRPTVFLATPPMIEVLGSCALAPGDEGAFRTVKACVCSTGRLGEAAQAAFRLRFGVPARVQYGSTETLSATVDLDDPFEEGRVGRPYPEVDVGIFDEDGHRCSAAEAGMIGIRSPAACDGYIGDPEAAARTFRGAYVFPGDRGYLDDAGRLHVLGRSDVINVGGDKVDPLEVEAVIRGALPVGDVVVLEGTRGGLPAVRAIVEADPARVNGGMVVTACRERLSAYKVPAFVEVRERLPRDANGKILRALLDR